LPLEGVSGIKTKRGNRGPERSGRFREGTLGRMGLEIDSKKRSGKEETEVSMYPETVSRTVRLFLPELRSPTPGAPALRGGELRGQDQKWSRGELV